MSLINEALKKAQRLRHEQPPGTTGDASSTEIRKRGRPMSAQNLLLLVAGGAVLVVFSVILTIYLLNRAPDSLAPASPPMKVAPVLNLDAPSPVIVAPVISQPTVALAEIPPAAAPAPTVEVSPLASSSAETSPALSTTVTPPTVPTPSSTTAAAPPASTAVTSPPAAATPAPATPDSAAAPPPSATSLPPGKAPVVSTAQIQQFVDALRVTGIRSSGADSKVLMNDRVYRVNDIIDRPLGLKLIKVAPDGLTFSDPGGATYHKHF